MIRVMIVDDERPIVEGLRTIIRKDLKEEFEVVATASSGSESLLLFEQTNPSVVLMDVMMPGLTGLETLKAIRLKDKNAIFILITASERFDIAREAVSLQVMEYLVKPIEREKVVSALRKAASQVIGNLTNLSQEWRIQEQKEQTRLFQTKALCFAIMTGEDLSETRTQLLDTLGLNTESVVVGAIIFRSEGAQSEYTSLAQTLHYKTRALLGPLAGDRSLILLPVTLKETSDMEIHSVVDPLLGAFPNLFDSGGARIGWGKPVEWARAHESWCDALMHSQLQDAQDALVVSDEGEGFFQFEERLWDGTTIDKSEALRTELKKDAMVWRNLGLVPPWGRYRWVILLGNLYRRMVLEGVISVQEAVGLMDFKDIIEETRTEEWVRRLEIRMSPILEQLKVRKRYSPPVYQGIETVSKTFDKQISLESVADQIGISPGRLSRLFVLETGKGFSEYLIDFRLERACKLLSQPGSSVKSVSISVGYTDPNYFARLFRKRLGLTPSSFQTKLEEVDHEE